CSAAHHALAGRCDASHESEARSRMIADKTLSLCTCNGTMPLDRDELAPAGVDVPHMHKAMCQHDLARFKADARGDMLVACTQERRLLGEIDEESSTRLTSRICTMHTD